MQRGRQRARPDAAPRARGRGGARQLRRRWRCSRPPSARSARDHGSRSDEPRGRARRRPRAGPRARPLGGGVRAAAGIPRAHADADRARHHLGAVVGALLLQVLEGLPQGVPDLGPARAAGPGRERRRRRHRRTAGWRSSRWRATTTRATSSPTRAPRPAWAASCATSSPWARGRSPASTRCASASSTRRACARWSTAWCAASATTATASASRRWAARPASTPRYNGNILVNAFALGIARARADLQRPRRRASATRSSTPARAPAATASTARPWPRTSFDAESEKKRPTVQVGDPFTEKILLEACLEAMRIDRDRRHPGHGRRRADQLDLRDGGARRRRHARSTSTACRCASRGSPPTR